MLLTTPFETTFSVVTRRLTTKYEAIFRNALFFTRMKKRPCLWPHLIRPYSNPPRHSASVPLSLAAVVLWSRISTHRLETQATCRRRRVIVFGLARSISKYFAIFRDISRYFAIFRDISRYFAKSNKFPREKNARRREHVQKVCCLLNGSPHLIWLNKVWTAI